MRLRACVHACGHRRTCARPPIVRVSAARELSSLVTRDSLDERGLEIRDCAGTIRGSRIGKLRKRRRRGRRRRKRGEEKKRRVARGSLPRPKFRSVGAHALGRVGTREWKVVGCRANSRDKTSSLSLSSLSGCKNERASRKARAGCDRPASESPVVNVLSEAARRLLMRSHFCVSHLPPRVACADQFCSLDACRANVTAAMHFRNGVPLPTGA